MPIPEDLASTFIDAFWHSLAWRDTTWLGTPRRQGADRPARLPGDHVAGSGPTGSSRPARGNGGRALFLASICELLGHGQVVSIDPTTTIADRPQHPRITYLRGRPSDEATVEAVRAITRRRAATASSSSARPRARQQTVKEFGSYARFVAVGSYVVVEDTIVNGHPVWPEFGPGPGEAVKQILTTRSDFVPDPTLERYALTFNPGGFLKRVR